MLLNKELGIHICGGPGNHLRQTSHELLPLGNTIGFDGAALAKVSRIVAKVDALPCRRDFEL